MSDAISREAASERVKRNIIVGRLYEIEDDLRALGRLQASYRARDLAQYVKRLPLKRKTTK